MHIYADCVLNLSFILLGLIYREITWACVQRLSYMSLILHLICIMVSGDLSTASEWLGISGSSSLPPTIGYFMSSSLIAIFETCHSYCNDCVLKWWLMCVRAGPGVLTGSGYFAPNCSKRVPPFKLLSSNKRTNKQIVKKTSLSVQGPRWPPCLLYIHWLHGLSLKEGH